MYIYDIAIECAKEDIPSLKRSEEERLQLILCPEEGDEWGIVSLERRWKLQWGTAKSYLDMEGLRFWVIVLADSNNGIAHALYDGTGSPDSGEQAIVLKVAGQRLALTVKWTTSNDIPEKCLTSFEAMSFEKFDACGHYFYRQFKATDELVLLSNSIDAWERASKVAATPDGLLETSKLLSCARYDEFCETGNPEVLPPAIRAARAAIELSKEDDPQLAGLLADLGLYQREQCNTEHHLLSIEESISTLRKAVRIAEYRDVETLPEYLTRLSLSLSKAFHMTGQLPYVQEAIDCGRRAVEMTDEEDPEYSKRLFALGLLFDGRYSQGRVASDDDEAISLMKEAIKRADCDKEPHRVAAMLDTLGTTLRFRFARTNNVSDIKRAVDAHRRAVSMASDKDLPGILNQLGVALDFAFYDSRDPCELEGALSSMRRSVALTKEDDLSLAERLRNMGVVLMSSFDYSNELKEIQEAILYFQKAVDATPKKSSLLALRLSDLSNALITRASFTGEVLDMDAALKMRLEEIDELEEGSERLPRALSDLGVILCRRFNMHKDIEDVHRAISAHQRAINVAPEGFSEIAYLHNLLGNANHIGFLALRTVEYIDAAIEAKRKAVSLLPEGHAKVPLYLNNLGRSYRAKFQKDGRMESLDEAIKCQRTAIEGTAGSGGGLPDWCADLSNSFLVKFRVTRSEADIDQAISAMKRAVDLLPPDHVDIPEREYTFGKLLMERHGVTQSQKDAKEACGHYKTSALSSHGYTARRVDAARKWADLARAFDAESSLEGYGRAIDLLSVFVGLEQTQSRRHENIAQISDLSRAAAATALETGEVAKALDWLERGRCLVWSQLNSLRTPVDDLRLIDEQLAERVVAVSKALESSGSQSGGMKVALDKDVTGNLNTSVDLAVEWKDLVSSIRQKPGFEDFLETEPFSMKDLPPTGTVVVINVHETRCDALALRAGWEVPVHIELPALSLTRAKKMAQGLRGHLGLGGVRLRGYEAEDRDDEEGRAIRRVRRGMSEFRLVGVLRDLWNAVVRPIFDAIGYLENDVPQRVWWCPTGPLSFLPLHAAGDFEGGRDTASDFAISSYSPNVSTLIRQMSTQRTSNRTPNRVLVVSQPKTPGHTPLPGTTREVKALREVLKRGNIYDVHLEGEEATVDSCANKLAEYDCVHFACHAFQDPKEPLASGFFLHDGRLELSRIVRNNLKTADLAFLSACQTSTGDDKLSEEAVHLAAGMVAAGYRGVVATMWSIKDQYAPEVATHFYAELTKLRSSGSGGDLDASKTAEALHFAVARLRSKLGSTEDGLLTWVPYVHFGV